MMLVCTRRDSLGSVINAHWVLTESHYCSYVNYDSDSDEEEMNEWKIESKLDNSNSHHCWNVSNM